MKNQTIKKIMKKLLQGQKNKRQKFKNTEKTFKKSNNSNHCILKMIQNRKTKTAKKNFKIKTKLKVSNKKQRTIKRKRKLMENLSQIKRF